MAVYYDWSTDSYKQAPDIRNLVPHLLSGAKAQSQSAAPEVDMSANVNSTPVQLMAKFVNSRGWGAPMPAQGMYDWKGNTIGNTIGTPANAPAQAQGGSANMPNEQWAALAGLLGKR